MSSSRVLGILLLLLCSAGHAVTAHVRSATPITGTCNLTCTITLASVGADTVTVAAIVEASTTVTINSVNDGTNAYTKTTGSPCTDAANTNSRVYVWKFAYGSAPGSITITITTSASATITRFADEFSGASGAMDVEACGTNSTGTAINTPSITPTVSGDFLYALCTAGGTISVATGSWTADTVTNGNDAEWQANVGTSAVAVGFTQSPSGGWNCINTAWKPSGTVAKTCTISLMGAGPC